MNAKGAFTAVAIAAALVFVLAASLASVTAAPTAELSHQVFLPWIGKNWFQIGGGWLHFGQKAAPVHFDWNSGQISPTLESCAGGVPPISDRWDSFGVFPIVNGTWIVFSGPGYDPWTGEQDLTAWRCEDGTTVTLATGLLEVGGKIFSELGENWLVLSRWDWHRNSSFPSIRGEIQTTNDGGITLTNISEVTDLMVDDVRNGRYAAYEQYFDDLIGKWVDCYEVGRFDRRWPTWETCHTYERSSQPSAQSVDNGRQWLAVSPSGQQLLVNWWSLRASDNSWACVLINLANDQITTLYETTGGANPCHGYVDWRENSASEEELWILHWDWFSGHKLQVFNTASGEWTLRNMPVTGTSMSLSEDGSRMYTMDSTQVYIYDTAALFPQPPGPPRPPDWAFNVLAAPSAVFPTH